MRLIWRRKSGAQWLARSSETGFALPLALVIVLILAILITAVLQQAAFDLEQGGRVERRIKAANAAEAGLAWYFRFLGSEGLNDRLSDSRWKQESGAGHFSRQSGTVLNLEGASFSIDVQYLKNDPCPTANPAPMTLLCNWQSDADKLDVTLPTFTTDWDEFFAIVTSTGVSGSGDSEVKRSLRSAVRLQRVPGSGLPYAVASSGLCIKGAASISGVVALVGDVIFPSGYPACASSTDLVISGTKLTMASGDLYLKNGSLQASGSSTSLDLHGDLWTGKTATLEGGPGSLNTQKCKASTKLCIWGDLLYNTPLPTLTGDVAVLGAQTQSSDPPPVGAFPNFRWVATDWKARQWTVDERTWSSLNSLTTWSKDTVYYVTDLCPSGGYTFPPATGTISITGDVAVVSKDCGFTFDSNASFSGPGKVSFLIDGQADFARPTSCSATSGTNIHIGSSPSFSQVSSVYLYTPCVLDVRNNAALRGQLVARFLYLENSQKIKFLRSVPASIPGATESFRISVRYITEVSA